VRAGYGKGVGGLGIKSHVDSPNHLHIFTTQLAYLGVILLALPLSIVGRHFQHQYDLLNMGDEQSPDETAAFLPEPGQPTTAPPSVQRRGID